MTMEVRANLLPALDGKPNDQDRALRSQVDLYRDLSRMRTQFVNRLKSLLHQEFVQLQLTKLGPKSHSLLDEQFRDQPELRFYLCSLGRSINHLNSELAKLNVIDTVGQPATLNPAA